MVNKQQEKFSRAQISAIQRLIKSRKLKIPLTKVWRDIHQITAIGQIDFKHIRFTHADIQYLRKEIKLEQGIDLQEAELVGNRTEITQHVKNDKLSNESPFATSLLLATRNPKGIAHKNGQCYSCPEDGFLSFTLECLDTQSIAALVIIENGRAFVDWHKFKMPKALDDAVFVYRGHGSNVSKIKGLLSALPSKTLTATFTDFDPAGIQIANDLALKAALFPDFTQNQKTIKKINDKSRIATQQHKVGRAYLNFKPELKAKYLHIIHNDYAFSQEAMAQHELALELVYIE